MLQCVRVCRWYVQHMRNTYVNSRTFRVSANRCHRHTLPGAFSTHTHTRARIRNPIVTAIRRVRVRSRARVPKEPATRAATTARRREGMRDLCIREFVFARTARTVYNLYVRACVCVHYIMTLNGEPETSRAA